MRASILIALLVLLPAVSFGADNVLSRSDRDALRQLDLGQAQWRKIDALVSSSQQRIRVLESEGQRISADLHRISTGNGDASRIPALAGRRAELAADRLKVRAGLRSRLNSILTPAQSMQLKRLLDQRVPVKIGVQSAGRRTPRTAWPFQP